MRRAWRFGALFLSTGVLWQAAAAISAITNGASYQGGVVSPGEIVVIFGTQLGPNTLVSGAVDPATSKFSTQVAQTQVLFDGVAAPILYVSALQTSVVVPYAVAGKLKTTIQVRYQGSVTGSSTMNILGSVPGLFSLNQSGGGQGAFFNQDGNSNSALNPARPGEVVVMFGTGEGQTKPTGMDGSLSGVPYPVPALPYEVTIGGKKAEVAYFGAAPGFIAGLFQLNVYVPQGLAKGDQPVVVKVGGSASAPSMPISLAVGGPPPVLSRNSGMPGERVSLTFPDATETSAVVLAFVRLDDGVAIPAPVDVLDGGVLSFYVPYIQDPTLPSGYVTGNVTIGVKRAGVLTGALNFRIAPLNAVSDPITKFRSMINGQVAFAKSQVSDPSTSDQLAGSTASFLAMIDRAAGPLLKMADSLAATGSAELPLDAFGGAGPTTHVTTRDIANMMAMAANDTAVHTAAGAAPKPGAAAEPANFMAAPLPRVSSNPACLTDNSAYAKCSTKAAYKAPPDIAKQFGFDAAFPMLRRALAIRPSPRGAQCSVDATALAPSVIAETFLAVLPDIKCKLSPTKPTHLNSMSTPDPIPLGPFTSSGNQGTKISLVLEPYWTSQFTVDQVFYSAYVWGLGHVLAQSLGGGCSIKFTADLGKLAKSMFTEARQELLQSVFKAGYTVEPELTTCDVTKLTPNVNHSEQSGETNYVAGSNISSPGRFRWALEGAAAGPSSVRIEAKDENFPFGLFATPYRDCDVGSQGFDLNHESDYATISPCIHVTVAAPKKDLQVTSTAVASKRNDTPKTTYYTPPIDVTGAPFSIGDTSFNSNTSLTVTRVSDTKYQIVQTVKGSSDTGPNTITNTWNVLDVSLLNKPGPRVIRAHVTSNVSGTCQGLEATLSGSSSDGTTALTQSQMNEGVNGCTADWNLQVWSGSQSGSNSADATLHVGVFVLGGTGTSFGIGSGTVTTDLELSDSTPTNP